MNAVTERLEVQLDQVWRDLAELEEQVASGELDTETAARLRATYEAEADALRSQLAAAVDAPPPASGPSSRRLWVGAAILIIGAAAITWGVIRSAEDRVPGGVATGGVAGEAVVGGGVDLDSVTNEEMEAVVAQNPDVVGMRLALARRYFEAGDFDKAFDHYMIVLEQQPHPEALANVGWMTYLSDRPDLAESFVLEALQQQPDYPQAQFYLAAIRLYGLGDPQGALDPLSRLAARDDLPDEIRARVDEMLAEIRDAGVTP